MSFVCLIAFDEKSFLFVVNLLQSLIMLLFALIGRLAQREVDTITVSVQTFRVVAEEENFVYCLS